MSVNKYVLDDAGEPVIEPSLMKWAMWLEGADLSVCSEERGNAWVSTIFLGIDPGFDPESRSPTLWETMVFGGEHDQQVSRCAGSREQAESMHRAVVSKLFGEVVKEGV